MIHILDVGANIGSFGLELARRNPQAAVHLIEPVPDLANELRRECAAARLSNAFVYEVALGATNGDSDLHISTLGDRGTTSMLPFDNRKIASNSYWSQRTDLLHETTVSVQTFRLRTFMEDHGIERIDFIKIDVQGLDLDVLASAEGYIGAIYAGMLEVPTTELNALYIGEQQTMHMALNFLNKNGFTVVAVKPNDPACNEVNIFFSRAPETWDMDISNWGLRGLPAFDGKHYWHAPSDSPLYANNLDRELRTENQRLLLRITELDAEINRSAVRIAEQDAEINRIAVRIVEQENHHQRKI
jgi:FkbM family methyltransferase